MHYTTKQYNTWLIDWLLCMETGVSAVLMVATVLSRGQRLLHFHTPPLLLLLLLLLQQVWDDWCCRVMSHLVWWVAVFVLSPVIFHGCSPSAVRLVLFTDVANAGVISCTEFLVWCVCLPCRAVVFPSEVWTVYWAWQI